MKNHKKIQAAAIALALVIKTIYDLKQEISVIQISVHLLYYFIVCTLLVIGLGLIMPHVYNAETRK